MLEKFTVALNIIRYRFLCPRARVLVLTESPSIQTQLSDLYYGSREFDRKIRFTYGRLRKIRDLYIS